MKSSIDVRSASVGTMVVHVGVDLGGATVVFTAVVVGAVVVLGASVGPTVELGATGILSPGDVMTGNSYACVVVGLCGDVAAAGSLELEQAEAAIESAPTTSAIRRIMNASSAAQWTCVNRSAGPAVRAGNAKSRSEDRLLLVAPPAFESVYPLYESQKYCWSGLP